MRKWMIVCAWSMAAALVLSARAEDQPSESTDVRTAIAAQNARYAAAVNRQDLEAFLDLFTDDATILQVGRTYKSRSEREVAAREQFAEVRDPVLRTTEVDVRGDLAYEIGEYTVTARKSIRQSSGTYLVVWRRQKDGEWKIQVEATVPAGFGTDAVLP